MFIRSIAVAAAVPQSTTSPQVMAKLNANRRRKASGHTDHPAHPPFTVVNSTL